MTLLPLLLSLLAPAPARSGQTAREPARETRTLLPLAVDLRRIYPSLEPRWRRLDEGGYRRAARGFRPEAGFLAAPAVGREARAAASLPRSADGPFVVRAGGVRVERALRGSAPAPAVAERGLLRYPGSFPEAETLFVDEGTGVRRYLLLNAPAAPTSFSESVRVRGGRLGSDPGGGLAVYDDRGRAAVRLPQPRVHDAAGRARTATVRVRGGPKGRYELEISFDPAGLAYPLLVE